MPRKIVVNVIDQNAESIRRYRHGFTNEVDVLYAGSIPIALIWETQTAPHAIAQASRLWAGSIAARIMEDESEETAFLQELQMSFLTNEFLDNA